MHDYKTSDIRLPESVQDLAVDLRYHVKPPNYHLFAEDVIDRKHRKLKEAGLDLGEPVGDRVVAPDLRQRQQVYSGGAIVWAKGGGGASEIHGTIWARFRDGIDPTKVWPAFPLTDETPTGRDSAGRFNRFGSRDYYGNVYEFASIYWSPRTKTAWWVITSPSFTVDGVGVPTIGERWLAMDANDGVMGYPIGAWTSEASPAHGQTFNSQQFEGGAITSYVSKSGETIIPAGNTYVAAVHGSIWGRLRALGGVQALGAPFDGVGASSDGVGVYAHFQDARSTPVLSSLFYHPRVPSGPYFVKGEIRERWIELGAEVAPSGLGYPISDDAPYGTSGGRMSRFERGTIYLSGTGGARVERPSSGSTSPTEIIQLFHLEREPIWAGLQPYRGRFWASGPIKSINVPGQFETPYFVTFWRLKEASADPGLIESWVSTNVLSGFSLNGSNLEPFLSGDRKSVDVRCTSSKITSDGLLLTITHVL